MDGSTMCTIFLIICCKEEVLNNQYNLNAFTYGTAQMQCHFTRSSLA